jgi:hypothetical protein
MTASLRSKSQKSNPKSQKSKAGAGKPGASAPGPDDDSRGIVPQPSRAPLPMKRRKGLFLALMSVFVVWVGVMLGMYVMTVRPQRHFEPPPSPQSPPPPPGATTTSPTSRALAQASALTT